MMSQLLQWQEIYCFQKVLPLLTRWQLFHYGQGNQNIPMRGVVWPDFIKKKRAPKGIASYEVIWKDDQNCFTGLIPDNQLETYLSGHSFKDETDALHSLWSTIEPTDLVEKAYPSLVETFLNSRAKKTKASKKKPAATLGTAARKPTKRSKNAANTSLQDMSDLQEAINELNAPDSGKKQVPPKKKRNPTKTVLANSNLQTLDKFFAPNNPKNGTLATELQEAAHKISPTLPNELSNVITFSMPMNLSKFDLDSDDSFSDDSTDENKENISQVIKEMVSRAPKTAEFGGKQLRFDEVDIKKLYAEIEGENPGATGSLVPRNSEDCHISFTDYRNNAHDLDDCFLDNMQNGSPNKQQVNSQTSLNVQSKHARELPKYSIAAAESSFDEFDFLVMKKSPSVNSKCQESLRTLELPVNKAVLSSTPALVSRFLTRHNLSTPKNSDGHSVKKSINLSATTDEQYPIKESSFFCPVQEENDEVDAFEQSIDFKNMDDAIDLDSDSD